MEGEFFKRYYKDEELPNQESVTYVEREAVAKQSLEKFKEIKEKLPKILKLPWEEIKEMSEEEWNERFEELYDIDPEPYLDD